MFAEVVEDARSRPVAFLSYAVLRPAPVLVFAFTGRWRCLAGYVAVVLAVDTAAFLRSRPRY
jgi:hypothetical protein